MSTIDYKTAFICPVCGSNFNISTHQFVCEKNHSFDIAKDGYCNLLVGRGRSTHGDNREMVVARREFLSLGHYRPLADRVATLTLESTSCGAGVLDAGCGEGYYTATVETALYERDGRSDVYAFDISKDAASRCAKRNPRIHTAVAGSYRMPFSDGSIATVINTFSPMAEDEVWRVLMPGGRFILAVPDADHLIELKAIIYDEPYRNALRDSQISGFTLVSDERLRYPFTLTSSAEVTSLFMMTPYAYRTSSTGRERVKAIDRLTVTADFHIYVYEKTEKR